MWISQVDNYIGQREDGKERREEESESGGEREEQGDDSDPLL